MNIEGCFDNIKHAALIELLGDFLFSPLILLWLKAGLFERCVFIETKMGIPQGGIIPPLLANIALH